MTDNTQINSQPDNGPRVNGSAIASDQPLPASDTPVSGNLALAPEKSQPLSLENNPVKTVAESNQAAANDAGMPTAANESSFSQNNPSPEPQKMSKGEKVFNWSVYSGLNYWVNLISSVAIADYFINPKSSGSAKLNSWISKSTKALTNMGVELKKAHHNSKIGIETFVLTSGGLILLAPLKWLEDHKRETVHKLNKKFGTSEKDADGRELTPDEIYIEQEQPKQSWGNVILRRIAGTAAVVVSGLALDRFAQDKKTILPEENYDLGFAKVKYDAKILGGKERVTNEIFGAIDKTKESLTGKKFPHNGVVSRWTKLAILDSVFTVITAVTMKVTNGAKKGKMPKEKDNTDHPRVIKDAEDNLVTADEVAVNGKAFSDRVEKRVNNLIESKREAAPKSFVESVKSNDASAMAAGV